MKGVADMEIDDLLSDAMKVLLETVEIMIAQGMIISELFDNKY